jgi:hypothetical protein
VLSSFVLFFFLPSFESLIVAVLYVHSYPLLFKLVFALFQTLVDICFSCPLLSDLFFLY